VATLVARGAQPDEVCLAVSDEVGRLFGTRLAAVGRFEPDGQALDVVGAGRMHERWELADFLPATEVFRTGRSARADSPRWESAEGETAERLRSLGIVSTAASPIVVEDELWGVMTLADTDGPLPPDTEERLEKFTEIVATSIANAESREDLQRLADEQAALRRVATVAAGGTGADELFAAVADEVQDLLGAEISAIVRFEDNWTVVTVGARGGPNAAGARAELDPDFVVASVRETRRAARFDTDDPAAADMPAIVRETGVRSAVATPIVVEGELWGAIVAGSRRSLPQETEARLGDFTDLVATAVANTQARQEVTVLADEQAALRRVATLVAQEASRAQVFSAIAREIGALLGLDVVRVVRYEDDGTAVVLAGSGMAEDLFPVGWRTPLALDSAASRVFKTGEPVRIDDYETASDTMTQTVRSSGIRGVVATPIWVEGRFWGAMTAATTQDEPLPPDTEARLGQFTELMATAIANAESKSELAASRRRIVAASDETRRRIERDLHDGTQQRLVSLGLAVRAAEANLPLDRDDLRDELSRVAMGLADAVDDLQEISRGIHPAILSKGGLGPALEGLARRSAIPVKLDIRADATVAEPIEVAAYYVASEALANAAKHAQASQIEVSLASRNGSLVLSICDDGVGGADLRRGSGLVGLNDRVEALGGSLRVVSREGGGTKITAELPLDFEQANAEAEGPGAVQN
jgi:signal transduction histidine kinase